MSKKISMKKTKKAEKQQTITKAFAKKDVDEESQELEKEVEELRKVLEEKQRLCFQARRNALKESSSRRKRGKENANSSKGLRSVAADDLIEESKIKKIEDILQLYSLMTGIQVGSYIRDDHCCVFYDICVDQTDIVRHAVRIRLDLEPQIIKDYSLPIGFRLKDVTSNYKNIMERGCLLAIHQALSAYYDRLEQINLLKKMVPYQVKTFQSTDGSELEISALLIFEGNSDKDSVTMVISLSYGVQDSLPTQVILLKKNLEKECANILQEQCKKFQSLPLQTAFMEAFMKNRKGHYVCLREDPQAQPNITASQNQSKLLAKGNKRKAALIRENIQDKGYSSESGVGEED